MYVWYSNGGSEPFNDWTAYHHLISRSLLCLFQCNSHQILIQKESSDEQFCFVFITQHAARSFLKIGNFSICFYFDVVTGVFLCKTFNLKFGIYFIVHGIYYFVHGTYYFVQWESEYRTFKLWKHLVKGLYNDGQPA